MGFETARYVSVWTVKNHRLPFCENPWLGYMNGFKEYSPTLLYPHNGTFATIIISGTYIMVFLNGDGLISHFLSCIASQGDNIHVRVLEVDC